MDSLPDSLGLDFLPALTGSFSTPARQNPTVEMVEAAYRHHKMHARYINCEVQPAQLRDAVAGARAMGWIGFNCSIPHKVAVIDHLDELGPTASVIGAVNCVIHRNGQLIGENTDGVGFLTSLKTRVDPEGRTALIFGAGGAARAIAVELAFAGCRRIEIVNRDLGRGRELGDLISSKTNAQVEAHSWERAFRVPETTDIVVNATSIGFYPHVDAMVNVVNESFLPHMVVADVIPNPPHTAFLRVAQARGCKTLDGLGMLVYQAVAAIKLWTGQEVDSAVMRAKLEAIFQTERAAP